MDLIFALTTLIFLSLFILRQYQYNKLKKFTNRLEKDLVAAQDRHTAHSAELNKSNIELIHKPSDMLTGLPGREAFDDRLMQALYQSKRYQTSIALMSVVLGDGEFEQLTNEVSDELLKQFARRIKSCIRQVDTVTRYVGNNFFILLPQIAKPETAAYVAQRIQDDLIRPFLIGSKDLYLKASIGIAIYPGDGDDLRDLIQNVTTAVSMSKLKKENSYQFYRQEIQELGEKELALATFIRQPNFLDKLQIEFHTQVSTANHSEVNGIHAACFIMHPQYGKVTYAQFLSLAENANKSVGIAKWVLKQSLNYIAELHTHEIKPHLLFMNIAKSEVENNEFMLDFIRLLKELNQHNVDLIIEITEDQMTGQHALNETSFIQLNHYGLKTAIGIYTVGHFALQRITNIPIDFLKINMATLESNLNLMQMMLSIIQNSDIKLIVYGVDTDRQTKLLEGINAYGIEGQLFDSLIPKKLLAHTKAAS